MEQDNMAVWASEEARKSALFAFIEKKSIFLNKWKVHVQKEKECAYLEVQLAQKKQLVAHLRETVLMKELKLLELQISHSRCSNTTHADAKPPNPRTRRISDVLSEDWRAEESRIDRLLQQMLETERRSPTLSRLHQLHADLRDAGVDEDLLDESWQQLQRWQRLWDAAHAHCPSTNTVGIEDLPESVLLEIFRRLPFKCLVQTAGRVSRAWRRVSRDRALWRDATFRLYGEPQDADVSVVRQAPAWRELKLLAREELPLVAYEALLRRDALPSLTVKLDAPALPKALLFVLRKHRASLASLALLVERDPRPAGVRKLWKTIGSMNLRELRVEWSGDILSTQCDADLSGLRLEELHVDGCVVTDAGVVPRILLASQTSLRKLTMVGVVQHPSIIQRISSCCSLREVRVLLSDNIRCLKSCQEIEKLTVWDSLEFPSKRSEGLPEILKDLLSPDGLPRLKVLEVWSTVNRSILDFILSQIQQERPNLVINTDIDMLRF